MLANLLCASVLLLAGNLFADGAKLPHLYTNQASIDDAAHASRLQLSDPLAVFDYVLGSLPQKVKVYPTENYYYFYFYNSGVRYAGNIRFDPSDRDKGYVHFSYYEDLNGGIHSPPVQFRLLGKTDGVSVVRIARLTYQLARHGRRVLFELNDLSAVRPAPGILAPGEEYIGPVFDESAMRFFLVFSKPLHTFEYILDETPPVSDAFYRTKLSERLLIGKRTGFALFKDYRLNRKILVGVLQINFRSNNYFDGPFDQLPDNFVQGDVLRQALLQVDPTLAGQINRLGIFGNGNRYLIAPFLRYQSEEDFAKLIKCASSRARTSPVYYRCFEADD